MTAIETRQYDMLARVREFGEAHRDLFPESTPAGQAFAIVAAAVADLAKQAKSKMSSARGGKGTKAPDRAALVGQLEAIRRTARVIARTTPGFDQAFQLPRPRSDSALVTAGRLFADDAEASKSQFIGLGMPRTFVTDLRELVEQFEQAIRGREAGLDGEVAARANIQEAIARGLAAVQPLDVIVANQTRDDPATMAVWERVRRVGYPKKAKDRAVAPSAPDSAQEVTAWPREALQGR